ncbi:hypothetical protein [Actinoplanes sp. NPDC020271]|uniref:hypothetical protein n=1 Tax=Actinoplanes sp. NPDC020271 TaxID=3363896 RepID=UPI00379C1833
METNSGTRPGVVTAGSLLLVTAGLTVAGEVLLSYDEYVTGMRVYEQAAVDHIIASQTAFAAYGGALHLCMATLGLLVAAGVVVAGLLSFFGIRWARMVAWIMAMPVLLWYGLLETIYVVFGGGKSPETELDRRLDEAWPDWLHTLDMTLIGVALATLGVALICQTVPAADAYFSRHVARPAPDSLLQL